ncbi:centrosomal protein of 135 kDa isoform X1 [Drosophila albomicans]|uniref:Centrosomal protein of 135 kDa isoform X1 n=1 Tax=Drosophila albomicans TaxID=7291 RepID=A0A6P8WQE8_DROAB|nr:centrosomal protein of 135 kDa isoform X1 [Drosophila albomicans]
MNLHDGDFKTLRSKLDVMGFTQTMPVLAMPLVGAIFGDLIKTTECLRDTKRQVAELLEEKTCWELGAEPYKCDNSRLMAECNELHLQNLKEREDYELRLCDCERRIRSLQTDREHLQSHNAQLQSQLDAFLSKQILTATTAKRTHPGSFQTKKPFISTVRSGEVLPAVLGNAPLSGLKCTKCSAGLNEKTSKDGLTTQTTQTNATDVVDRLQNELRSSSDQLEFYKRKVESRNREIRRLNDMLSGGRPPAALAKDCCYKDVGVLSQDIDLLQREKSELMAQVREYQDKMHDAMQRALRIEEEKRKMQTHLDELKEAALQVEQQANSELDAREHELRQLQVELKQLQLHSEQRGKKQGFDGANATHNDKRKLNEKLNLLTRREEELEAMNTKLKQRLRQMQDKLQELEKQLHDQHNTATLDEEKIRIKSERDFFQKEYLRLINKCGSDTEISFLQAQIKSKDEELRALRSELCMLPPTTRLYLSPRKGNHCEGSRPATASSSNDSSNRSECVQAAIARVERERDCARSELERMRCERDNLREKQLGSVQLHAEEVQSLRMRNEELQSHIRRLEMDNRELNSARVPAETHNAFLKEDVAQLKQRMTSLQAEIDKQRKENAQISLLNEQNERIIADYQSKLLIAERQRQKADVLVSTLDTSRETNRNDNAQLRSEIASLRQTYVALELEKDTLLNQLDNKTERLLKMEYEFKDCKQRRNALEQTVKELESQVDKLTTRTRQRDSELTETSAESKTLRQQIVALKASRDEAIAENGRLADKLSDAQVEAKSLHKKLKDCEQQVATMKQQLHKYVAEVKKAEDLLMTKVLCFVLKEKEREELLDHYHSLTHDQVLLEGNNQSLEFEATEFRRQICELECEVRTLKDQLHCRQCSIEDLEMQLTAARASQRCLERELENAREQKIELDVHKELCEKLDVEKEKLNAELNELSEIRKKLEKECEKLRSELHQKSLINQVTTDTTGQMLDRLRDEQLRQDDAEVRAKNEMERLQQLHETTLRELQQERARCNQQERLATEFEKQARELRQNLTEDRFCLARSRENSPKIPPKTL